MTNKILVCILSAVFVSGCADFVPNEMGHIQQAACNDCWAVPCYRVDMHTMRHVKMTERERAAYRERIPAGEKIWMKGCK